MAFPPVRAAAGLLALGLIAGCAAAGARGTAPGAAGSAAATAGPAAPGQGAQAGCAPWPAGSTGTVLLVTAASNGRSYCVQPGQTVRLLLSGPQAAAGGLPPPRLIGDALAVQRGHPPAPSAASYTAVHPGTAVLLIVRLPCHSVPAGQGTATAECLVEQLVRVSIIVR